MKPDTTSTQTGRSPVLNLAAQAEDLSSDCKSLIEITAELDIQRDWFTDRALDHASARQYPVETLVPLFLFQHARELSTTELTDWLIARGETSRFNLPRAPSPQLLSRVWQHEFSHTDRAVIRRAALHLRFIHDSD